MHHTIMEFAAALIIVMTCMYVQGRPQILDKPPAVLLHAFSFWLKKVIYCVDYSFLKYVRWYCVFLGFIYRFILTVVGWGLIDNKVVWSLPYQSPTLDIIKVVVLFFVCHLKWDRQCASSCIYHYKTFKSKMQEKHFKVPLKQSYRLLVKRSQYSKLL